MNIIHALQQNCQRLGEKPIFVEGETAVGYAAFYRSVCAVAAHLQKQGVRPGDKVLVLMPLSTDLYATLCGVWAAGACVVIFDPSAGGGHIAACLAAIDVAAFVGNSQSLLLRIINRSVRKIPQRLHVNRLVKTFDGCEGFSIAELAPDAPALITFTSGSTGIPKAIVRTHGFLLQQHAAIVGALPYYEDDIDLAVLSVFTLVNMMEGITTVLPQDSLRNIGKVNVAKLVRQIEKNGVTRITASPRLLKKLADWAKQRDIRLNTLRSVNIGGGPVFLDVLERVAEVADPDAIRVVYGSTEAEPIAEIAYRDFTLRTKRLMRDGSGLLVGIPTGAVQLKVLRSRAGIPVSATQFMSLEAPTGEWGEIVVAGRHVVQGYLDPGQDILAKIQVNGTVWHRTGDCGYLDGKNRLWLLGRIAQVIPTELGPLFPFAVESAIRAKYKVAAAVICVDGRIVLAVERTRYLENIRAEYKNRFTLLPIRKIPLDRRHSSKVDYGALADIVRNAMPPHDSQPKE